MTSANNTLKSESSEGCFVSVRSFRCAPVSENRMPSESFKCLLDAVVHCGSLMFVMNILLISGIRSKHLLVLFGAPQDRIQ